MREASSTDFIRRFRDEPSSSLLLLDFDGTLSAVAPTPEGAVLHPEAHWLLTRLTSRYRVYVVSGRPAEELSGLLGLEGVRCLIGLHGLEKLEKGRRSTLRGAEGYLEAMAEARKEMEGQVRGLEGVTVEDKGLIIAVHYRRNPRAAGEVEGAAARLAAARGLGLHRGRMVVELRPPLVYGKGRAVEEAVRREGAARALYAGDDLTDVDAFRSLHRLENELMGFSALAVAAVSEESPPGLLEECDLAVPGVEGVIDLLSLL